MTDTIPICWGCDGAGILATEDGEDAFECTICEGSGLADSAGGPILPEETDPEEGPPPRHGDHGTCAVCGGQIAYYEETRHNGVEDESLSAWWSHLDHPADGHDAQLGGPA